MSDISTAQLARAGATDPLGKLVKRIDVPISERLDEAVTAIAVMHGMPKAEYVRKVLEREMFGALNMMRSVTQQAAMCPSDECRG